jgi:hypothetical protein
MSFLQTTVVERNTVCNTFQIPEMAPGFILLEERQGEVVKV